MYKINFLDGTTKEFETLIEADLRRANLREADLRRADLRVSNLYKANLEGADLRGVDLRGADLEGANLRGANLEGTKGILSFTGGRHLAFAYMYNKQFRIKIGCKDFSLEFWLEHIDTIGTNNMYSTQEINRYLHFIEGVKKYGI